MVFGFCLVGGWIGKFSRFGDLFLVKWMVVYRKMCWKGNDLLY